MICATFVALVMAAAPTVVIAEPVTVAGTMTWSDGEVLSTRTAGENMFVKVHNVWSVSGDLIGELNSYPYVIFLGTGEVKVLEWGELSVAWGDDEGTLRVRNVGAMGDPGMFHLDSVIVGGTGDLAKVRGYGYIDVNDNEGTATYSFELYWEED